MSAMIGVALAALAALCVACQAMCIRLGTEHGKSNDALVVVILVNLSVLVPGALLLGYPDYGLTPTALVAFATAGVTGTLVGRGLLYAGISRIGASRAEPIKASTPLFAAVIAVIVLGETLSPEHLAGILLIAGGVAFISRESRSDGAGGAVPYKHLLLPLGAAFFFGVEPTLAKFGFAEGTPFVVGLAIKTGVASIGLLGYLWYRNDLPSATGLRSDGSLKWYFAAGVASTFFLSSFYAALSIAPVVVVAPIMNASPLVVVVLSFVFLQRLERVTWKLGGGAALVVIGAIAVTIFS